MVEWVGDVVGSNCGELNDTWKAVGTLRRQKSDTHCELTALPSQHFFSFWLSLTNTDKYEKSRLISRGKVQMKMHELKKLIHHHE